MTISIIQHHQINFNLIMIQDSHFSSWSVLELNKFNYTNKLVSILYLVQLGKTNLIYL